jgi:hypothetical protein
MSGTYHSRVFSFIHSQTNKLKDSCAQGWRHFKVAVVWTGQMLVYPFYRLAETTKLFIPQTPKTSSPRLAAPQPPADITIEAALELVAIEGYPVQIGNKAVPIVDDWSSIDEDLWDTSLAPLAIKEQSIGYLSTPPSPTPPRRVIHGLGSLLANRNLVLVTTENEILDVLTRQQKRDLQMRVSKELATKLLAGENTKFPALTPQPPHIDRELPPLPRPRSAQTWWHKLLNQPMSPSLGLVGTLPRQPILESAPIEQNPQSISDVPDSLVRESPGISDFSQIIPDNPRSKGITSWAKQLWEYYREYIHIDLPQEVVEKSLTPIDRSELGILHQANSPTDIEALSSTKSTFGVEYQPDWIETEVTDLGYARSPVARLLTWLDQVMLKIENWTIKIWHAILDLLRSKQT